MKDTTTIWFGKYKGKKWSELHINTLQWYRENLTGIVKDLAEQEIERRDMQYADTNNSNTYYQGEK